MESSGDKIQSHHLAIADAMWLPKLNESLTPDPCWRNNVGNSRPSRIWTAKLSI